MLTLDNWKPQTLTCTAAKRLTHVAFHVLFQEATLSVAVGVGVVRVVGEDEVATLLNSRAIPAGILSLLLIHPRDLRRRVKRQHLSARPQASAFGLRKRYRRR